MPRIVGPPAVHSERVTTTIVPATLEHLDALIADDGSFESAFGLTEIEGYLAFPEALAEVRKALAGGEPSEWSTYLFIDPDAGELVGLGGYHGPPVDGIVEFGLSVAPARRRQGHAKEATRQLIARASNEGVAVVRAHTLAEPGASVNLLLGFGFRKVLAYSDPEDGPLWRWELQTGGGAYQWEPPRAVTAGVESLSPEASRGRM